jgi:hypothetical protein
MATEEQIKDLAHALWEREGRPEGKSSEHYFRAKQILEAKEVARIIELAPQTPPIELASPPPGKTKKSTRHKGK